MKKFKLIAFDIDGTLTQSKLPLDVEMAGLLCRLMEKYKVAIISGASYGQFQWQILDPLACRPEIMKNLYLLPVDGTVFCYDRDGWQCQNDAPLSPEERKRIQAAFGNIFEESGFVKPDKIYGELVEDRGAQFNFSALGQEAPIVIYSTATSSAQDAPRGMEFLFSPNRLNVAISRARSFEDVQDQYEALRQDLFEIFLAAP